MPRKKYKVGDRVFFECYDGSIDTSKIIDIEDEFYINDKGKKIHYQMLTLWRGKNYSSCIEDYNCISPTNPRVKELAKKFKEYDSKVDGILNTVHTLIGGFSSKEKADFISILASMHEIEGYE